MNALDSLEAKVMTAMAIIMNEHPYVIADELIPEQENLFVGGYDAYRIVLQWIEEERTNQNG